MCKFHLASPGKTAPPPPPRASSRGAAKDKFSQTLQRDSPSRLVKRDISYQFGTLPTHGATRTVKTTIDGREGYPRPVQRTMSAGSTTSGASTLSGSSSPVTVRYEGGTNVHDKDQLQAKASGLRRDLGTLRAQLGQLRQMQAYQAKAFDDMLRNAKEQIVRTVARLSPSTFRQASRCFAGFAQNIHANLAKRVNKDKKIKMKLFSQSYVFGRNLAQNSVCDVCHNVE